MSQRSQRNQKKHEASEESPYESTTVGVYRTAATVKGGRRFSFSALAVVGDKKGRVGYGYGKASEVPPAIEKAEKYGRRDLKKIDLKEGTIPHVVWGKFGAAKVKLVPASPGTGVIAGATVRAVLELAGVRDCMTKAYGSTNQKNLVKATIRALEKLRYRNEVERLRGVELEETEVDEMIKRGQAFLPPVREVTEKPKQQEAEGGSRKSHKGQKKRTGEGGQASAPQAAEAAAEPPAAEPTSESEPGVTGESGETNS